MSDSTEPVETVRPEEVSTEVGGDRRAIARLGRARDLLGRVDDRMRQSVEARLFGGRAVLGGRYSLEERIGSGGCGVVYRAHDPELDRDVAIKVLRSEHLDEDERRRSAARLLREAKAASHVNHPNVVTIYDVGVDGDAVFVAMELLHGRDLRAWLRQQERGWQEVRDVFVAAARGLEAVHACGLVHRDFKPTNVFLTDEGRVCLLDFGLSKLTDHGTAETHTESAPWSGHEPELGSLSGTLTAPGDVLGTPLYMAPEQHESRRAGAEADQFALCASMYEALCGAPAFSAATVPQLHVAKLAGELCVPPSGRAPRRMWRVLRRGLRSDPAERWPGVAELRRALERIGRPRIGRRSIAVVGVGLVLGGAATLDLSRRVESVGEAVVAATPSVDLGAVREAHRRLERARALDAEGRPADALAEAEHARRVADDEGDHALFAEASFLAARLDTRALPPSEAVDVFEALFFEVARREQPRVAARIAADLVFQHGVLLSRPERALRWAEHARSQLDRLRPGAHMIALEHGTGSALRHAGWLEPARQHLERAVELAERHGDPSTRAKCEIELAATLHARGEAAAAHALAVAAVATLEEVHGADDPVLAQALQVVSQGHIAAGEWDRAADVLGRALALQRAAPEDMPLPRAVSLTRLAGAEARSGRLDLARAHAAEAQEVIEGVAVDPITAAALRVDIAVVLADLEEHQRIVDLLVAGVHDELAGLVAVGARGRVRLAGALTALGRAPEAREHLRMARRVLEDDERIDEATRGSLRLGIAVQLAAAGECGEAWPTLSATPEEDVALLTAHQRAELWFLEAVCDPEGASLHLAEDALAEPLPPTPASQRLHRRIERWVRAHAR